MTMRARVFLTVVFSLAFLLFIVVEGVSTAINSAAHPPKIVLPATIAPSPSAGVIPIGTPTIPSTLPPVSTQVQGQSTYYNAQSYQFYYPSTYTVQHNTLSNGDIEVTITSADGSSVLEIAPYNKAPSDTALNAVLSNLETEHGVSFTSQDASSTSLKVGNKSWLVIGGKYGAGYPQNQVLVGICSRYEFWAMAPENVMQGVFTQVFEQILISLNP